MGSRVALALLLVAVPVVGLVGGGRLLFAISGRPQPAGQERPLYSRLAGYSAAEVADCWNEVAVSPGLELERRFLQLDLAFPLVYGGTLLISMLVLRSLLVRPFPWILPAGLVALVAAADWTENLIQLRQLDRFLAGGEASLQPAWIRWASVATTVKLAGTGLGFVLLLVLAGLYVARP